MPDSFRTIETEAFFAGFKYARRLPAGTRHAVVRFGDTPELIDALLDLVLSGRKRATASLMRDFPPTGTEDPPEIGGYVVVVDSTGAPRCIFRTIALRLGPLDSVDEAFARDEGEGDGTRASWLEAHRRYFAAQAARDAFPFDDGIETVFERFRLVWPAELADG